MATTKPVTEVASFHFKNKTAVEEKGTPSYVTWHQVIDLVTKQDGQHGLYHGNAIEDPSLTQWVTDWSAGAYEKYASSSDRAAVMEKLGSLTTEEPDVRHIAPAAFPAPLWGIAPVMEMTTMYNIKPGLVDEIEKFLIGATRTKVDGLYGYTWGPVVEDVSKTKEEPKGKAAMMIMGWQTRDAHYAFANTPGYKQYQPALLGSTLYSGFEFHHTMFNASQLPAPRL